MKAEGETKVQEFKEDISRLKDASGQDKHLLADLIYNTYKWKVYLGAKSNAHQLLCLALGYIVGFTVCYFYLG